MTTTDMINFGGLLLNILGTLIMAFSLSKYLTSIHGALYIHDKQLGTVMQRESWPYTADVAKLLKTGVEDSRIKTLIGLVVVILGFIVQLTPYVLMVLKVKI